MDIDRVSCCTIPLRGQELDRAFEVISQAGYAKIDLLGRMPHFDLSNPDYDFERTMALADSFGLRIANIGSYCGDGFVSDDEEERQRSLADLMAVIDAAAACGARSIRTRPGHPEDPALIDRLVPCYQRAAEYAETKGVYMGIENHGGPISGSPERCTALFDKVGNKYAGILYEPCNLQAAGVDYKRAFEVMKDHITHVHLKDCYEIDGKMQRVWLGTGMLDFRWILSSLERIGYDGDVALEYEVHDEPPETGVGKWLDWILKI
jgi:sugar phosphate isomerase/epimerase